MDNPETSSPSDADFNEIILQIKIEPEDVEDEETMLPSAAVSEPDIDYENSPVPLASGIRRSCCPTLNQALLRKIKATLRREEREFRPPPSRSSQRTIVLNSRKMRVIREANERKRRQVAEEMKRAKERRREAIEKKRLEQAEEKKRAEKRRREQAKEKKRAEKRRHVEKDKKLRESKMKTRSATRGKGKKAANTSI